MAANVDPSLEGITLQEPPRRDPRLCRDRHYGTTYAEQAQQADLHWKLHVIHQLSKPYLSNRVATPTSVWVGQYVDWCFNRANEV